MFARGEALGQYSHPKANTAAREPVAGLMWNIHFMTFLLINFLFSAFYVLTVKKKIFSE